MKFVVFGSEITCARCGEHALLWRGLLRSLAQRRHRVVFFERERRAHALHRDLGEIPGATIVLYPDWASLVPRAVAELADADVGLVDSAGPDAVPATERVLDAPGLSVFYDLDPEATLVGIEEGRAPRWLGPYRLADFDLVLGRSGGDGLRTLSTHFGARRTAPLYDGVDIRIPRSGPPFAHYQADLSYLGAWSPGRSRGLERLFLEPARRVPAGRFLLAGEPASRERLSANVWLLGPLAAPERGAYYAAAPLTVDVAPERLEASGHCPSARLFEAATRGVPVLTGYWDGLERFLRPGFEILVAHTAEQAIEILSMDRGELVRIGWRARERALEEHTYERRVDELEALLGDASRSADRPGVRVHAT